MWSADGIPNLVVMVRHLIDNELPEARQKVRLVIAFSFLLANMSVTWPTTCPPFGLCFTCNPPQWMQLFSRSLPLADRPLKVATSCVGLDAGYPPGWALRLDYLPACIYDIEPNLFQAPKASTLASVWSLTWVLLQVTSLNSRWTRYLIDLNYLIRLIHLI